MSILSMFRTVFAMYFFENGMYNSVIRNKGDMKMYAIIYYNDFVKNNVIVYASSVYEQVEKMYNMKYKDDDFTEFKIVKM